MSQFFTPKRKESLKTATEFMDLFLLVGVTFTLFLFFPEVLIAYPVIYLVQLSAMFVATYSRLSKLFSWRPLTRLGEFEKYAYIALVILGVLCLSVATFILLFVESLSICARMAVAIPYIFLGVCATFTIGAIIDFCSKAWRYFSGSDPNIDNGDVLAAGINMGIQFVFLAFLCVLSFCPPLALAASVGIMAALTLNVGFFTLQNTRFGRYIKSKVSDLRAWWHERSYRKIFDAEDVPKPEPMFSKRQCPYLKVSSDVETEPRSGRKAFFDVDRELDSKSFAPLDGVGVEEKDCDGSAELTFG